MCLQRCSLSTSLFNLREATRRSPSRGWLWDLAMQCEDLCAPEAAKTHKGTGAARLGLTVALGSCLMPWRNGLCVQHNRAAAAVGLDLECPRERGGCCALAGSSQKLVLLRKNLLPKPSFPGCFCQAVGLHDGWGSSSDSEAIRTEVSSSLSSPPSSRQSSLSVA